MQESAAIQSYTQVSRKKGPLLCDNDALNYWHKMIFGVVADLKLKILFFVED